MERSVRRRGPEPDVPAFIDMEVCRALGRECQRVGATAVHTRVRVATEGIRWSRVRAQYAGLERPGHAARAADHVFPLAFVCLELAAVGVVADHPVFGIPGARPV